MSEPTPKQTTEPHISDGEGLFKDDDYAGRAPASVPTPTTDTYAIVRSRLANGLRIGDGDIVQLCDEIERLRAENRILRSDDGWWRDGVKKQ